MDLWGLLTVHAHPDGGAICRLLAGMAASAHDL